MKLGSVFSDFSAEPPAEDIAEGIEEGEHDGYSEGEYDDGADYNDQRT